MSHFIEEDKENRQNKRVDLLSFSPQKLPVKQTSKAKIENTSDSIPVLLCAPFQSSLWIGFGCVPLHTSITKIFELRNETKKPSQVVIENWETTSACRAGFSLTFGSTKSQKVLLDPSASIIGYVTWTPTIDQCISENAIIKVNDKLALQVTLHGISGTGEVSNKVLSINCY